MESFKQSSPDYVTRVLGSIAEVPEETWNGLLEQADAPTPFMRHEYLLALHESGCATPDTGWTPLVLTLWLENSLAAACPVYIKGHSYGEYVFDWSWANAYADHGLPYYPKAVIAVPFTPVPGSRLLAINTGAREALAKAAILLCQQHGLSSLHLLFGSPGDLLTCRSAGMMQRQTMQFHWHNRSLGGSVWPDFEQFLADLRQDKRKKIRQERRKVADAGVIVRSASGDDITDLDWQFLQHCYARTYLEHGNPPYLNAAFFQLLRRTMSPHWLVFIAERGGQPMAASLIGLDPDRKVAYGRYWGAIERVDSLHFECCYYSPIQWCIEHGYHRFEGGAQGEHKMSRALLPAVTHSAHWLAHPAFADAVGRYLEREAAGIDNYHRQLDARSPVKHHNDHLQSSAKHD